MRNTGRSGPKLNDQLYLGSPRHIKVQGPPYLLIVTSRPRYELCTTYPAHYDELRHAVEELPCRCHESGGFRCSCPSIRYVEMPSDYLRLTKQAPLRGREAEPTNIYGQAHTLKMADDAFKREAAPANVYGQAHTLKLADDEYKKREAEPANIYGQAHTLKMADDAFKREAKPANVYGQAHTLKLADDEYKKREAAPANVYGQAHTLKMADDAFKV